MSLWLWVIGVQREYRKCRQCAEEIIRSRWTITGWSHLESRLDRDHYASVEKTGRGVEA